MSNYQTVGECLASLSSDSLAHATPESLSSLTSSLDSIFREATPDVKTTLNEKACFVWNESIRQQLKGSADNSYFIAELRNLAFVLFELSTPQPHEGNENLFMIATKTASAYLNSKQNDRALSFLNKATAFLNPQDHSAHPETVSLPRQKLFHEFNLVYLELSWSKEPYQQSQATYNLLFTPADLSDANILWELSNLLYTFGAAAVSKSCDEEAVFWYQEALTCLDQKVEWETDTSPQKAKLIRIITPVLVRLKQFSSAEHYIALLLSTDRSDFALQSAITFFATTRKEDSALSLWKELVDSKVKQADEGNGDWDEDQFTFLHASLIDFRQYSHQFSTSAFECLINQYQIRGVPTLVTLTANINFFSLLIDNSHTFPHSSQSTHPDFETLALQRAEMMLQMSQEFLRNSPDGINDDFTTWQHSFYTLAWNEGVDQFSKSNFHSSISFFMLCLLIDLSQSESISTEVSPIPLHSFSSLSIKVPVSPSPNLVPLIRTISFAYLSSQNITEAESACQFLATLEGSTTLSPLSRLLTLKLALRKGNLDEAKTIATALIESHSSDTPARSGMLVDETDHSTPPPPTAATTIPTDTSALLDVLESVAQEFESVGEPEFCLAFLREYLNSFELTGSEGEQAGKLEKKMFALVQMLQLHTHHPEASWDLKEMGQLFTTLKDTVIELQRRHHNWKDDSKGMIDWCYRCAWNAGIEAGHRSEMTICVSCFESALFFLHNMETQPLVSPESIQQVKRTARVDLSNAKKDNVIVPKEEERTCHMMIASSQLDYIRSNTLDSHTKTQLARQALNHLDIALTEDLLADPHLLADDPPAPLLISLQFEACVYLREEKAERLLQIARVGKMGGKMLLVMSSLVRKEVDREVTTPLHSLPSRFSLTSLHQRTLKASLEVFTQELHDMTENGADPVHHNTLIQTISFISEINRLIITYQPNKQSCYPHYTAVHSLIRSHPHMQQFYPKDEMLWLVTSAWNNGSYYFKMSNFSEAEKWMSLAISLGSCSRCLDESHEMMAKMYSEAVRLKSFVREE